MQILSRHFRLFVVSFTLNFLLISGLILPLARFVSAQTYSQESPQPSPTVTPIDSPSPTPVITSPSPQVVVFNQAVAIATSQQTITNNVTNTISNNFIQTASTPTPQADRRIEALKTDGKSEVAPGELVEYQIVIRNFGDDDLTDVKIIDYLPLYLIPHEVPADVVADAPARTLTWNNQTIAATTEVTFSFTARVEAITPNRTILRNQATITSPDISRSVEDSTLVIAVPTPVPAAPPVPITARTGSNPALITIISTLLGTASLLWLRRK